MYDIAIVGSGIGGMTAAIYAARAGLNHVMIEKEPFPGGQIIKTAEVDNFPGFEKVSGTELAMKVKSHCDKAGVKTMEGEVVRIEKMVNNKSTESKDNEMDRERPAFRLKLNNGKMVETENVILAIGAKPRLLNVPGEEEFSGRGVSYCATCDGPLYRNKKVVVFGGGDSALRTVLYLAGLAAEVTLVHRRDEFKADKPLIEKAMSLQNVTIITDAVPENIVGDELISGVNIFNRKSGEKLFLECNGVFIAVGTEPATGNFLNKTEQSESDEQLVSIVTDDRGYIVAGEDCKTSVEGIYAIGDCRSGRLKQLITAAADGAVAVAGIKADKDMRY